MYQCKHYWLSIHISWHVKVCVCVCVHVMFFFFFSLFVLKKKKMAFEVLIYLPSLVYLIMWSWSLAFCACWFIQILIEGKLILSLKVLFFCTSFFLLFLLIVLLSQIFSCIFFFLMYTTSQWILQQKNIHRPKGSSHQISVYKFNWA